ncbi:Auxin Efflux Carrier [Ignisphaera aggregans DSM 17230]|uniref:Auxin Efflux Carrier n=1 Tax=Ignisphaera aggregans (strain DSM 17230 / JCM 13409 / AQ1.S1) TaxID=583356 RepID=E0SRP6_IGNAA|nr:Auxin Efflux Carrier [Ignisphaera aggregans DSM 17230]
MIQFLLMAILILIGYVIGFLNYRKIISIINNFLFFVTVPILIFLSILGLQNVEEFLIMLLISLIHILTMLLGTYYISRTILSNRIDRITMTIAISMPNTAYLAIPLSLIIFGKSSPVIPYMTAFNLFLPPLLLYLSLTLGSSSGNRLLLRPVPHIATFIIAITIKILIGQFVIPIALSEIVNYMNYLSFIVLGGQLALVSTKDISNAKRVILLASIAKYIISPITALTLFSITTLYRDISREYLDGYILQSIMPPAINVIVISEVYRLNSKLSTLLLVVMTPISIVLSILLKFI